MSHTNPCWRHLPAEARFTMQRSRVVTCVDRVSRMLGMSGLLGLAGLAGLADPTYYRFSGLSFLSFVAFFRFFTFFFGEPFHLPEKRIAIFFLVFFFLFPLGFVVPLLLPHVPALGFLGFLGFLGYALDAHPRLERQT